MHLKRLDLVGFKSFATRTTFLFEPGISVLCGPNGSGKSNVSDAVRWALGEQSARAIRGRRAEDVIFVGSQGRQPLGLAEVSLTLDNSDGRIPLDYAEVKVSRRLYRSGESEYLVNGSRVRLKDIHGWLLHAALDPNAYVVVGQGSVDELILQRPEERRVVLENAADIRRHNARLAETRSKLGSAEENLLRCRTVIAELEPHVKRLRAQAERAERYEACRSELSSLAARWFRHTASGARAELVAAREALVAARAELERLENDLAELEASARVSSEQANSADEALSRLEVELDATRAEVSRLGRELAVADERERAAAAVQPALRQQIEASAARAAALEAEIAATESEVESGLAGLAASERDVVAASSADAADQEALRSIESQLDTHRRRAAALDADARAARGELQQANDRHGRARRRLEHVAAEHGRLEAEVEIATELATRLAAEAERGRNAVVELRRRRDELASSRDEIRRELDRLRTEQHRLTGEQQRAQIARRAVEEAAAQAHPGVTLVLKAGLDGVKGMLGGELKVPESLRPAISAALGESTQAVLVESPDDAFAALRLVHERGAGRTGLVLLNGVAEAPPPEIVLDFKTVARPLLADLDLHGFADELVECDDDLAVVRARYLAHVVVAPDLDRAREAARRLATNTTASVPWQVVTMDGQAIRWSGEWRAGRDRTGERLVARRQELADQDAVLRQLAAEIDDLATRIETGNARASALAGEESATRERLSTAERADRDAAVAAQSAAARLQRLRTDLGASANAGPAAEADVRRAERLVEELGERIRRLDAERAEVSRELADLEAQTERTRRAWEQRQTTRAEQRAALTTQRAAIDAQLALIARERQELALIRRQIGEAEARLANESAREADESARVETLRGKLEAAEGRVGPLVERVAASRAARRAANEARTALEERAARHRGAVRSQRTVVEAAAVAETRTADRLDRIRREAQELDDEVSIEGDGPIQLSLVFEDDAVSEVTEAATEPALDPDAVRRRMNALRRELRSIGPIGSGTLAEFTELRDRHEFLTVQTRDLESTTAELRRVMAELEEMMRGAFDSAFIQVNTAFGEYFGRLFGGGHAELVLSQPDDVLATGVDIVARPPGKRLQPLVSLSGGERALTMVALIFGLLKTNPAPFCVLDEVDAALDESNVRRFTTMLEELSDRTQFVVVTHNRATMEIAQALYGISMDTNGVSTVVSLRLPEATASV